jgi:magnesium-transporting ATPase (P-type)
MQHPPRRKNQRLIDRFLLLRALGLGIIETLLCYSGFILVYFLGGQFTALQFSLDVPWFLLIPPEQIQAVAVTIFHAGVVTAQVGNAFACRTETNRGRSLGWSSNPLLLYSIAGELAIILGLIYIPSLAQAFEHVWLPLQFWSWLLIYPVVLYSLDWLRKRITMGSKRKRA